MRKDNNPPDKMSDNWLFKCRDPSGVSGAHEKKKKTHTKGTEWGWGWSENKTGKGIMEVSRLDWTGKVGCCAGGGGGAEEEKRKSTGERRMKVHDCSC